MVNDCFELSAFAGWKGHDNYQFAHFPALERRHESIQAVLLLTNARHVEVILGDTNHGKLLHVNEDKHGHFLNLVFHFKEFILCGLCGQCCGIFDF